jgi:hypothetical protein
LLKVPLGLIVGGLDKGGLLSQSIISDDLLEIELQLVVVGDRDVRTNKRVLVVVESFPEGSEVFVPLPVFSLTERRGGAISCSDARGFGIL